MSAHHEDDVDMYPRFSFSRVSWDGYEEVEMCAGYRGVERVEPPAGTPYAYEKTRWRRKVTVCVSPTQRSVRVFVDGVEVAPRAQKTPKSKTRRA